LNKVGNLVHESVPIFKDEANNVVENTWGTEKIDKEWKVTEEYGFAHHH